MVYICWSTHIYPQEARPVIEYAQVDKTKKKTSQEKHRTATEYDDAMVEDKLTEVSVQNI